MRIKSTLDSRRIDDSSVGRMHFRLAIPPARRHLREVLLESSRALFIRFENCESLASFGGYRGSFVQHCDQQITQPATEMSKNRRWELVQLHIAHGIPNTASAREEEQDSST